MAIHAKVSSVNSSPPEQNGCHLMNEKLSIFIQISLTFVPKGPIDYKPALVQVMAWWQTGSKPLPEPMLTQFTDPYMQH